MGSFDELYSRLIKEAAQGKTIRELEPQREKEDVFSSLDCLFHPDRYAPVWRVDPCGCSGEDAACIKSCIFDAIKQDDKGNATIDKDACTGCYACVESCKAEKLAGRKDILPVLAALSEPKGPVYAMIAPAFIGQFRPEVTPGMLRSAFKRLGFAGMVEVALFADIITLREALEFDRSVRTEKDFILTSCCCPIWLAMIRKIYSEYISHIPGSVSPMVACGRSIRQLIPGSVTVFVGPCIAKKAEAREPDIADAVDHVLTFEEMKEIFDAFDIRPETMEEDMRDHSSRSGRIYARTGGVSESVQDTVNRLSPDRFIHVNARQADGVPACKEMMNRLKNGDIDANFLEGMGCVGGCVGGPKVVLNREEGRDHVNDYGGQAVYPTPVDNPYVIELLDGLGFHTVESLLDEGGIFARKFTDLNKATSAVKAEV